MAMTKIKGLQMWCRKMTEGYPNVSVDNFTTAWRNGLAFCAIIHRFRPDLIDFDSLSPENVLHNNKIAFEIAEKELGIPAFLEADDMARLKVPDKLSVITYVSQYYNFLNALPQLGGPGVKGSGPKKTSSISGVKRAPDEDTSQAPSTKKTVKSSISPSAEALKQEKQSSPRQNSVGDRCAICQNKVYLLERHIEEGKLYHRSCFRHSELSPTNRVFTRSPFMSPSLKAEKAGQENHLEKRQEKSTPLSRQGDNVMVQSKDTPMTKDTAKSNLSSMLKRVEGAGMKHSIASEREEDSKKSKFQPKSLFESKSSTSAPKHGTEDMGKRTDQKDKDNVSSALPLSSKEARKLEKRRQEILDSEKAPKANGGAKRSMPLIFQQKDSPATTPAPVSSSSAFISIPSSAAQAKPSVSASSSSDKSGLSSSKFANERHQPKTDSTKSEVSGKEITPSQNVLRKQSAPSIASLQQKFSAFGDDAKSPVAKPRLSTAKEVQSKPSNTEIAGAQLHSNVTLREKENFPKPAPRKSQVEPTSKKLPPERPKYSPRAKHSSSAESSSSADEKSTPRSSSSTSPPPLPTSPPPSLPSSQPPSFAISSSHHPPPLPTSLPPSLPSSNPPNSEVPTSKSSSSTPASISHSSVVSDSSQAPKTTAPGRLSKTPATKDVSLSNKSPRTHQLSSSSESGKEPSVAVLVTPTTKKEEGSVLTGLLTSLAGIRGRSASTPNVVEASTTTASAFSTTVSHSSVSSSTPSSSTHTTSSSRKYSEPLEISSLKPVASTSTTTNPTKVSNASSVPGSKVKSTVSTSASQLTNVTKTTSKSTHPEKMPEALSILSSLKPVSSSDTSKTSKPQSSFSSATNIEDKMKARSQIDSKARSQSDPKALSQSDIKGRSHSDPKILSDVKLKTETHDALKSNSSSNTKENSAFLKDVHLKRVMPEPKASVGGSTSHSPPFNIALKKVEPSASIAEPKKSVERFQVPGDIKTVGDSNKAKDSKLSVSRNQTTDNDDNIPQWKKDIEERKKKLREDIARSEAKTPASYTRHVKERPKSADILSLLENSKESRSDSLSSVSESPRSDSSSSSISSSSSSKRRSKSIADINADSNGKLDWQLEAERRIAAFALFDSSEDEGKSSARKKKSDDTGETVMRQNKSEDSRHLATTKHTPNTKSNALVSEPKNSEVKGNLKPHNYIKQNTRKNNLTEAQNQMKELAGFHSKVELRAVNINISSEGGMDHGDRNRVAQHSKGDSQGKVTLTEPLSINNSNNNMPETPKIRPPPPPPSQENSDKSQITPAISPISIESTSSSAASDNESLKENRRGKGEQVENKDKEEKNKDKEEQDTTTTSPKLKRKITFLGKADSDTKSPPPLRKITVDREFDFDSNSLASSEFEASLTQSTSQLVLNDEHTPVSSHPPERPPRPKSQRNKTPSPRQISAIELQQQLMEIDSRLTDLELRGRDLEDSIRNDFVDGADIERDYKFNDLDDESVNTLEEDDEELMIQWFSLVREKNDLVRQEADLVYLSREQDLEDEQHQIDAQLRYLMNKEENIKSPQEKEEEDYLLQRKLDIVNQRSSIVDSMDEDRLRYEEEDRNIEDVLLEKGLIRNASGSLMAKKGLKVAKSKFYA